MRHFDIVQERLKNRPQDEEQLNHAVHVMLRVSVSIGCEPGAMMSYILDKYKINSIFIPLVSSEDARSIMRQVPEITS